MRQDNILTRSYLKTASIVLVLLCCSSIKLRSQNLFDCSHSLSFASYLKSQGSLKLSAKVLLEAGDSCLNDSVILEILKLDILVKDYELTYNHSVNLMPKVRSFAAQSSISSIMLKSKMAAGFNPTTTEWISCSALIRPDSFLYLRKSGFLLNFSNKKKEAADTIVIQSMIYWEQAKKEIAFKNPAKAALLSVAIPGMGKAYAGLKKDALISFISVGVSTLQAIRGFNARGTSSVYGWVSSAFAISFYGGSIYGSVASVKKYNQKKIDEYRKKFIASVFLY